MTSNSLLSLRGAAELLGLTPPSVQRLVDCHMLGVVQQTPSSTLVTRDAVEALAARPFVEPPHPGALALRLGPPKPIVDRVADAGPGYEREHLGWDEADPDTSARRDSWRGWWKIARPHDLVGTLAIATVSGFVVDVALVVAVNVVDGYTVMSLADVEGSGAERFTGRRVRLARGMGAVRFIEGDGWPPPTGGGTGDLAGIQRSFQALRTQGTALAAAALRAGMTWEGIAAINSVDEQTARSLWESTGSEA